MFNLATYFWKYSSYFAYREFSVNRHRVSEIQSRNLKRILKESSGSQFSKKFNIDHQTTKSEFQSKVPITEYFDYEPYLEKIVEGQENILTKSRIKRIGLTSGSSGKFKFIPFTEQLAAEYSKSIGVWIYGLLSQNPDLLRGRFYFSVSPSGFPEIQNEKLKIGFDKDSDYLKPWERLFVNSLLVVPEWLGAHSDSEFVSYITCLRLLSAPDLSLISVWNPSFFTSILDKIENEKVDLLNDLKTGRLSKFENSKSARLLDSLRIKDKDRSLKLFSIIDGSTNWQAVWPNLKHMSLWTDSFASHSFQKLKRILPSIKYESKGVFATEGSLTIPFYENDNEAKHLLAYSSHFFEFLGEDGLVYLPEELAEGREYEILMTTGGGFYRYRIGDRFQVITKVGNIPALRFLGRKDDVSDLVGEKINETFLKNEMSDLFCRFAFSEKNSFVRGNLTEGRVFYELVIGFDITPEEEEILNSMFEGVMNKNPYYAYARRMGQLAMSRITKGNHFFTQISRSSTTKDKFLKKPYSNSTKF